MISSVWHLFFHLRQRVFPGFFSAARLAGVGLMIVCLSGRLAVADPVTVAVATNFAEPLRKIAAEFAKSTGHQIVPAFASTGTFYAQIKSGAPFEILLAADDQRPARLEKEGFGVRDSRFTYAIGKLLLWSRTAAFVDSQGEILKQDSFQHLAIANPKLAPYGAAAVDVVKALGLTEKLADKLVIGENVGKTYQFIVSGNAELGFIALSQVYRAGHFHSGSGWLIPQSLYRPIRQDAVLLAKGHGQTAAETFFGYLRSEKAKSIIRSFGYEI